MSDDTARALSMGLIQTVSPGRIVTLHQLHERLCDGLAIKKRYINVLYITLHVALTSKSKRVRMKPNKNKIINKY